MRYVFAKLIEANSPTKNHLNSITPKLSRLQTVVLKTRKMLAGVRSMFWKSSPKSSVKALNCMRTASLLRSMPPHSSSHVNNCHFEEIKIPVPWGHLAGKWYGSKHLRPIVGMHGWQDNAGTFDTLAPLLPQHIAFLSVDMPGHGLSSWLPDGITYHSIDYVFIIRRIMEEMKWDKISILGHSMSSINGFVFSALFPDKVDMFIGLDALKPISRSAPKVIDSLAERLESWVRIEKRIASKTEPPSYEWEQLVERLHHGTEKSVSLEACKYLLQRNIKPSRHEPHKYFFSRDSRLKSSIFYAFPREVPLEMARRIKCPHLFIKALQGPYYEKKAYFDENIEMLKKNPNFEFHEVEGTHHVHLNEPQKVAGIINSFINKWRPVGR